MSLRPLHDTLVVEHEDSELVDVNESSHDAIKSGLLVIPEYNSLEKISQFAKVVSYGPKCKHKFQIGQRIMIERFRDTPYWVYVEGKKYRLIRESYVLATIE